MFATGPQIAAVVDSARCRHCGEECGADSVRSADGVFCCLGCESVFSILKAHHLDAFYRCDVGPGVSQKTTGDRDPARFAALDEPEIASRLIDFNNGRLARATLSIASIHCASCVWLLEQLWRFDPGIARSEVDLMRRTVRVEFRPQVTSLRRIAEQLSALGYEPALTPGEGRPEVPSVRRRLYLQLGVAGFAFGNIMLFSIPRYANGAPLDGGFQRLFDVLNLLFAIPVLFFSASDYFRTAWRAARARTMAMEVPVALGLTALFIRSVFDISSGHGEGFMDSFAGLVFFLLVGRLFQQKVFDRVAFDRTFRSFLPLAVQLEGASGMSTTPIDRLRAGDRIVLRLREVVPADALLVDEAALIDYAFLTGEQTPVAVRFGETIRAGGRVLDRAIRLRVLREVSHSQIAGFWSHQVFHQPKAYVLIDLAARFGTWFTVAAVGLAAVGAIVWWPDLATSLNVATAVLIIACPCALTLAAPIALGTAMGQLGIRGLYLKHPAVALDLGRIDTIAFDKTGTLTASEGCTQIEHSGLSTRALLAIRRLAAESLHPTSRAIAGHFVADRASDARHLDLTRVQFVREVLGQGICGTVGSDFVVIGTPSFIEAETGLPVVGPDEATYVSVNDERGWIRVTVAARPGIDRTAHLLSASHELHLLSGDHGGERHRWERVFGSRMHFRQSPDDKLEFISDAQARGRHVLMVGDGLNDAGALAVADVGMAVSDEVACVAPACDAVIDGLRLTVLPMFLSYARRARHVIVACFVVSMIYNVVGVGLALAGLLTPLVAAIFMPVSSLTIVAMSAGLMRWFAGRMLPV
jgi:P-type Cu+ transporter